MQIIPTFDDFRKKKRHNRSDATAVILPRGQGSIETIATQARSQGYQKLFFSDPSFFADTQTGLALCESIRRTHMNMLWSASLNHVPSNKLLKAMRTTGCQNLTLALESSDALTTLEKARQYGFDVCARNVDGTPYAIDRISYSVKEREAIAERLPDVHAVQFDLAVAYFNTRRFHDVMLPLGKAMTLGFPLNELCLNLLACLSAARHYPDIAFGLLTQAEYGPGNPLIERNIQRLKTWKDRGGDIRGVRLMLEAESSSPGFPMHDF